MDEKSIYRVRTFFSAVGIVAFIAIIVWFVVGLAKTKDMSDEQRRKNVRQSVLNGAVMCYSVEGFYPDGLDYLKENYGVSYDEKRYVVVYDYTSSDICPFVIVYDNREARGGVTA